MGHLPDYRNASNEMINLGRDRLCRVFGRLKHNGRGRQNGNLPAPLLTAFQVNIITPLCCDMSYLLPFICFCFVRINKVVQICRGRTL